MKRLHLIAGFMIGTLALAACEVPAATTSADQQEARKTRQMAAEAARQSGLPDITSFTEKKFAKQIYELRDREISTYSYFMDFQGRLFFLCESVGFGLPFSVQYVNPNYVEDEKSWDGTDTILPQAEPNGLFMPDGLSATWVLCSDGEGGVAPVYSEPNLIVSPFRLKAAVDLRAERITSGSVDATWEGATPVGAPEDQ